MIEPFNRDSQERNFSGLVRDEKSLAAALEEIWKTHDGFKHVWDPSGWPFEMNLNLNERVLARANQQVLFLYRRNILRRLISSQISEQLGVWTETDEFRDRVQRFAFKPIDGERLQLCLDAERTAMTRQRQSLAAHGVDYLELVYEDLFVNATTQQQVDKLNDILNFLGRDKLTDERALSRVAALFNPRNSKLNSDETYQLVPQIEEIESRFGSDETGWLFH